MSTDNVFDVWQFAYVMPVYRVLVGARRLTRGDTVTTFHDDPIAYLTQWRPMAGVDFTDATLDLWAFDLTHEYDGSAAQCPCGDYLEAADVGELLESIREHCDRKHPGALKVV